MKRTGSHRPSRPRSDAPGTVAASPEPVPAGAILSIRIVDNANPTSGPVLLGQQRVQISGEPPFEFRAEYRADDALLRRGVNVEVKILVNGKLRYANLTSYMVTLGRAASSQETREVSKVHKVKRNA